jgi:2',3'-cyclic-nucleotide 2'-phosphodiesterase (5'-nucleotidase family)
VREYVKVNPATLLVDLGDTFDPPDSSDWERKATVIVGSMNRMGYVAMNLGEEELDRGEPLLALLQRESAFRILGQRQSNTPPRLRVPEPFVITETGGLRVAIVGIEKEPQETSRGNTPDSVALSGPISYLAGLVPKLKGRSDLVLVLAHMLRSEAEALARAVPGIGVILYAHETFPQETPQLIGQTVVVGGGWRGQRVGVLRLFLGAERRVVAFEGHFVSLTRAYTPDTHILHKVQKYRHGRWTSPEKGRGA